MAKYSFEFKMRVVNEYLHGKLGYVLLAKKYNIPSKSVIENWVAVHHKYELQGLKRSRQRKTYSFQFKRHAVELYLNTETSYQEVALLLGIKYRGHVSGLGAAVSCGRVGGAQTTTERQQ